MGATCTCWLWCGLTWLGEQLLDQLCKLSELCLDHLVLLSDAGKPGVDIPILHWFEVICGCVSQSLLLAELAVLGNMLALGVTTPRL